jgi:hypothetical protein
MGAQNIVDTHGQSPWHFEIFKLCLTPFGRVLIHPRAKPVEPCHSGYWILNGAFDFGELFKTNDNEDYTFGALFPEKGRRS